MDLNLFRITPGGKWHIEHSWALCYHGMSPKKIEAVRKSLLIWDSIQEYGTTLIFQDGKEYTDICGTCARNFKSRLKRNPKQVQPC